MGTEPRARPPLWQYAALVVVGLGLVAGAIWTETRRDAAPAARPTPRVVGELGPTPGPDAEGYIADKRTHLEAVAASNPEKDAAGLVSFGRLLRSVDVSPLVAGMRADAVFMLFPGSDPEASMISGSIEVVVGSRAAEHAEVRRAEIADLEDRLGDASEEERAELDQRIAERRMWLNQLTGECYCVYAVAVGDTSLGALLELGGNPDVRLVDVPDPPVADLRGWELRPILPRPD